MIFQSVGNAKYQTANAPNRTSGTQMAVNFSMPLWSRGGTSRKVWTASMRPESRVSFPTATTSHRTGPCARTSPASMVSPARTSTGTDSPVSGALFRAPVPSMMRPSAGMSSPLRISILSPGFTKSMGTMSILGSLCIIAFSPGPAAKPGVSPAGAMENDDMLSTVSSGCPCNFRAVLGKRSKPPCIASRALISASPSKWMVNATRMVTINASSHMPRMHAPMTAKLVRTWKPI